MFDESESETEIQVPIKDFKLDFSVTSQ